jgi:NADH-quinone oxidoreductase subunit A
MLPAIILAASHIFGQRAKGNYIKDKAYECGLPAEGKVHPRFAVKFYVTAMLFILFDIEVIFMYPWAVSLMGFQQSGLGWQVFGLMLAFVLLVEVGHLYAYKKGVFDWNKRG